VPLIALKSLADVDASRRELPYAFLHQSLPDSFLPKDFSKDDVGDNIKSWDVLQTTRFIHDT
jgi:hypothetical protein